MPEYMEHDAKMPKFIVERKRALIDREHKVSEGCVLGGFHVAFITLNNFLLFVCHYTVDGIRSQESWMILRTTYK